MPCLSFPPPRWSRLAADGDPHFVVDFPRSRLTVCFNIDGQPGDILRLVSDHADSGRFCPEREELWGYRIKKTNANVCLPPPCSMESQHLQIRGSGNRWLRNAVSGWHTPSWHGNQALE